MHTLEQLKKENARLQMVAVRLKVMESFAAEIFSYKNLEEILWGIAQKAMANLDFEDCVIYILNEETNMLCQRAAYGPKNPNGKFILNEICIPMGEGIVGSVAKSGKMELIHDTSNDPRYIKDDKARYSELAIPIKVDGKVIGVIDSEHSDKNYFTEEHVEIIKTICIMAANKIKQLLDKEKIIKYQTQLEQIVKERTNALNEHIKALKISNYNLEQYAHIASHDLQEPILTIKNFTQLLNTKENISPGDSKKYMNLIIKSVDEMQEMLRGLLEFSKINEHNDNAEACDLNLIVQDVLASIDFSIQKSNTEINISDTLPIIKINPSLIKQVFQNLIGNAIKFNSNTHPKINIKYSKNDTSLFFEFIDNGIGINSLEKDKVFNLFYKGASKNLKIGNGLGLSICKRIIEHYKGEIGLKSEGENSGSNFYFKLPLRLLVHS